MKEISEAVLLLFAAPVITVAMAAELIFSNFAGKRIYSWTGLAENIYLTSLNMIVDVLFRTFTLLVLLFFYEYRVIQIQNSFFYWMFLLVTEDFLFYWLHRFDHQCRIFWAVHVTHHSAREFNLTVGFRSSVFQPLYRFLYFIPLAVAGFHPTDIFIMYSLTQLYGILIHTTAVDKLGWLEYILVTPSHHRVHHGSNTAYLDRNLGMVFIIWDKLFGTFTPENEKVVYGLKHELTKRNAVNLVLHEWQSLFRDLLNAPTWSDRLRYIFGPPGWSHDGKTMTSRQLQEIAIRESYSTKELSPDRLTLVETEDEK